MFFQKFTPSTTTAIIIVASLRFACVKELNWTQKRHYIPIIHKQSNSILSTENHILEPVNWATPLTCDFLKPNQFRTVWASKEKKNLFTSKITFLSPNQLCKRILPIFNFITTHWEVETWNYSCSRWPPYCSSPTNKQQ